MGEKGWRDDGESRKLQGILDYGGIEHKTHA